MNNDDYARAVIRILRDKAQSLEDAALADFKSIPFWRIFAKREAQIEWRAWRRVRALCQVVIEFDPATS